MNPVTSKVHRRSTFDGYEVAGWRHSDQPSWKVKVWIAGCPRDWVRLHGYGGYVRVEDVCSCSKEAVLHAIGAWEAELVDPKVRNEPFDPCPSDQPHLLSGSRM
jgi:hypothetical protein